MFTYELSRPYPYRWLTYVVWLGGAAALALFTVVSSAANGYTTKYNLRNELHFRQLNLNSVTFVTNPNETEHPSHPAWYQKSPWSWASKVRLQCRIAMSNCSD
jgi:hypothetical protein